jgi:hypothetical protein
MDDMRDSDRLPMLRAYAEGRLGTRWTIEHLGMRDYADLVIALAQQGLDLPKPPNTPRHEEQVARARAILQPLLRRGD